MASPTVRSDYDALKQIAASFGGQAQAARQTLQNLQSQMDVLQGGDWVGQGAYAFYQEMGDAVMPTLKRLAGALESAQQSTLQISQVMQQAEAAAAQVLRGDGANGRQVGPAAPGPAGGGGGGSGGAGGAAAFTAGGPTLAERVAKLVDQDNAAVDQKLAGFSPGVRDLVKKSPTLRAQIAELQQKNFTIQAGAPDSGFWTKSAQHTINIQQPLDDAATTAALAHEVGHAVNDQPIFTPAPGVTRDQFVSGAVQTEMHNEGQAQFNAAQARAEINAAGGPDIGLPGSQTAAYQKAYDDFVAGNTTHDQAVDQMAALMANEHVSIPPHQAYGDFYRDSFEFDWDTNIDQPAAPPRSPR